jgi:hypothetical protein
MNNSNLVLSALKSQLEIKTSEIINFERDVVDPENAAKTQEILNWLTENVSNLITKITADQNSIEIMRFGNSSKWGACSLQLDTANWKSLEKHMDFRWYSSRANAQDGFVLADVQVFGSIAAKFQEIENMFKYDWSPAFKAIMSKIDPLYTEQNDLQRAIREVEAKIKEETILEYQKVGKVYNLKDSVEMDRNWDTGEVSLVNKKASIRFQYGRSRHDYTHVHSYQITKLSKGKAIVQVFSDNRSPRVYEVSNQRLQDFIKEVYYWEHINQPSTENRTRARYASEIAQQQSTI